MTGRQGTEATRTEASVEDLTARFAALAVTLEAVAAGLRSPGTPPSHDVVEELQRCRADFEVLQASYRQALEAAQIFNRPLDSLEDLTAARAKLATHEALGQYLREQFEKAIAVLDKVARLAHVDKDDFPPLRSCQNEADDLRRKLQTAPQAADADSHLELIQALADGQHPHAQLLALAFDIDDDERCMELYDRLIESLDRLVVAAALRKRLVLRPSEAVQAVVAAPQFDGPTAGQKVQVRRKHPLIGGIDPATAKPSDGLTGASDWLSNSMSMTSPGPLKLVGPDMGSANPPRKVRRKMERQGKAEVTIPPFMKTPIIPTQTPAATSDIKPASVVPPVPPSQNSSPEVVIEKVVPQSVAKASSEAAAASEKPAVPADPRSEDHRSPVIWSLIQGDRLGLAHGLVEATEAQGVNAGHLPPAWLLRAAALAQHVRYGNGEIAADLIRDFAHYDPSQLAQGDPALEQALQLLLVASALRPALIAPGTGACAVLRTVQPKDRLHALFSYCQALAGFGERSQGLDPRLLKRVKSQAAWETELREFQVEAEKWRLEQAPGMNMAYAPATQVWRKWLEPAGLVDALFAPIMKSDATRLQQVRAEVERLSRDSIIEDAIDHTYRKVLKHRGDDITAKALMQLLSRMHEAVSLARRWVELHETRPGQEQTFANQQIEALRRDVEGQHAAVVEELEAYAQRQAEPIALAAAQACLRAVRNLGELFDPERPMSNDEPQTRWLLRGEFLKIPRLDLNDSWEPEGTDPDMLIAGAVALTSPDAVGWEAAFHAHLEHKDLLSAQRVLELLAFQREGIDRDTLIEAFEQRLATCQAALERHLQQATASVEKEVAFGLLKDSDRGRYLGRIEAIRQAKDELLTFRQAEEALRGIGEAILDERATQIERARQNMREKGIGEGHPAFARIDDVLSQGDLLTANEYIGMVAQGRELPEQSDRRNVFHEFFKERFRDLNHFLENRTPNDIARMVEAREDFAGLNMKRVAGAQAKEAAELLRAWNHAKRSKRIDEATATKILGSLGFTVRGLKFETAGAHLRIDLEAEPIRDKERCPVSAYGSSANGRYVILCVWDRPTEDDLLADIGKLHLDGPLLVLYFARMTDMKRRDMARLCRERRRAVVLLDDMLLHFLCAERGSRLPVLFECGLPFTSLIPYATTASIVPPEIFYGRQAERESILSRTGSCFIYGGRQLGKTALLRDAERSFHNPDAGRYARWIDLKGRGIGFDRDLDKVWRELTLEFKQMGVLPPSVTEHIGGPRLIEHLKDWLKKNEGSRILLLLDEADRFLESDGKEQFTRTALLKNLMDETDRRFKVVFAGLHNVQRTTRIGNHSLAHFGEPICIGPLLDNGEWKEARALVERPLASLGYEFESPDLVTRILSQTNYYPSLIQLYCNQLLKHVTNPHVVSFSPKDSPPYKITSQHVKDAYLNQDLTKSIRDRFIWTLQLDHRYEVIAYALAYETRLDGEKGMVSGFSISYIRNEAIRWWPEGFEESASEDAFRTLLEEMIGLGILRLVQDGYYALRSPSLISLLGTEEDIERQLLVKREVPAEYEPASFRAAYRDPNRPNVTDPSRRNPLSALQEGELRAAKNGVSVLFGSDAAGLGDVADFLLSSLGDEYLIHVANLAEAHQFTRRLAELDDRPKDGTTLLLVDSTCAWTDVWVEEAVRKVEKLKSKTSFVRVAFLADPRTVWQLCRDGGTAIEAFKARGVSLVNLSPWKAGALRQWLDECGYVQSHRDRILAATGGWPLLIRRLHGACKGDPLKLEAGLRELEGALADPVSREELRRAFGLEHEAPITVLKALADWGELSLEEMATVVEDVPPALILGCIEWAELLQLVLPADGDKWKLAPTLLALLSSAGG